MALVESRVPLQRYTGNYMDQRHGFGYHEQLLTFHEFMEKEAAIFMVDPDFMQIPGYVEKANQIALIEETARQYVVDWIFQEFEHRFLGMENYERWAVLFKNKCDNICPSFWSQVHMIDLMFSNELETDENLYERNGNIMATRTGGSTTNSNQTSNQTTQSTTEEDRKTMTRQLNDSETRQSAANLSAIGGLVIGDAMEYDLENAADNYAETHTRAGDIEQDIKGTVTGNSTTNGSAETTSTTTAVNAQDNTTNLGNDKHTLTNKQFMLERQWAINTAQMLQPLEWLKAQLSPMFYMVY